MSQPSEEGRRVSELKYLLVPRGQGRTPHPFRIRSVRFSPWRQMPPIVPRFGCQLSEENGFPPPLITMGLSLWCLFNRCSSCHLRTPTACFAWLCSAQLMLYFSFVALLRKMMPVAEALSESLFSIDPHFPLRCLIFSLSVPQVRGEQAERPVRNTVIRLACDVFLLSFPASQLSVLQLLSVRHPTSGTGFASRTVSIIYPDCTGAGSSLKQCDEDVFQHLVSYGFGLQRTYGMSCGAEMTRAFWQIPTLKSTAMQVQGKCLSRH